MVDKSKNYGDKTYILYLPDTMFTYNNLGEIVRFEDEYTKSFYNQIQVELDCETIYEPGIKKHTINMFQFIRTEKKELGLRIEELENRFKELNIHVPAYEIKTLLKHFNISEK
jgi:hypothetical protein